MAMQLFITSKIIQQYKKKHCKNKQYIIHNFKISIVYIYKKITL